MFVIGEFLGKKSVAESIHRLRQNGVGDQDLDIFSEEPIELHHGVLDRPSHMSLAAVIGAITLGGLATLGVYLAQHHYVLNTGGMPTFSMWGSGVVTYETTMMGAVLATFVMFLWESGLVRKRDKTAPVPAVPPGMICLRVRCEDGAANKTAEIMKTAGAVEVLRKEKA